MSSIVGPFPTKFSPGRECTAVTSDSVVGIDFATACLPDDFDPAPSAYYSPGIECPSGYTAQKSCTRSSGDDEKTTVTCCPQRNNINMWCVEDPGTLSGPWESLFCTWSAGNKQTVILVTTSVSGTESTTAVTMNGGEGINAFGLRMIYEPSDIPNTEASTTDASTTAASTTAASTSGATNEPAQTSSGDSNDSGGISTGAIAAIAVVIPIVVIAALVGAFIWWRRRRRQTPGVVAEDPNAPKELPPSHGSSELYGSQAAQELPGSGTFVSELPGDTPMGAAKSTATSSPGFSRTDAVSPALTSNNGTSPAMGHSAVSSPSEHGLGRSA
ncbi:hypothetical protein NW762_004497 [Fusarium torreyae]|uniref:Uncharacterized protein n=1 Tax=Fusarium torreyae TaxID=1237075 RepID=A0A9W8VKB2_9HYPO|nr:hypothetical protein NW762_004497 [Fusarium torreyae]